MRCGQRYGTGEWSLALAFNEVFAFTYLHCNTVCSGLPKERLTRLADRTHHCYLCILHIASPGGQKVCTISIGNVAALQ